MMGSGMKGNPFWVTASKNGLKTASYFWVGSEALIKGERPTYYKNITSEMKARKELTQLLIG